MIASSYFIATEPLGTKGETGEQIVWDSIQLAFSERKCLAYWRYPIFSPVERQENLHSFQKFRKEPDILIVDRQLGLIIIEVKSIRIEQIVSIQGHRWQYQKFYTDYGSPYQQAETQLFALLEYTDREPLLKDKLTARAIVALPYITESDWQARAFDRLPSNPPILFKNHLLKSSELDKFIEQMPTVGDSDRLTEHQWQLLLAILTGSSLLTPSTRHFLVTKQSRGDILKQVRSRSVSLREASLLRSPQSTSAKLRSHFAKLDLQQEKIAKQIPPGLQTIRGIAGSGKTIILCQKAALMHLKYPDWQIAFVFFSRSLYQLITEKISQWINYFSGGKQTYNPHNSNLKILHAWGGKQQPGFYSTICQLAGKLPLAVKFTESYQPNEALGEVCFQLLQSTAIPQVFDAILIDEGQDLIVDSWKYQNKQPFYWLAYQSLRPVNPLCPEQKRLIWAYDELQSLNSEKIPTASELFGQELGHLLTGRHSNNINKTEIITCCYRTPHLILTAAHAIAMGLLRPQGMLTGFATKEEWEALGYQVEGNFKLGEQIIIKRSPNNSPNPISQLWQGEVIKFEKYVSRQQELTILANNIKYNLRKDGLRPAQEILVIVLGNHWEANELALSTAKFLHRQGIYIYLPNHNHFWDEGAVTITNIHRAKGQEADIVYLIGLDQIAKNESNLYLRNQLLVALTRARGWVYISGISNYPLYQELEQVIQSKDTFKVSFNSFPQRAISITNLSELLTGYALGRRNFRNINLQQADLSGLNLANINLIKANLIGANLTNTCLKEAKLIAADLSNANLTNADLTKAKLMGANLQNSNLTNANFTDTDLTNANLINSDLENYKFKNE
jgi:superfamily I DNA and RNA helicase